MTLFSENSKLFFISPSTQCFCVIFIVLFLLLNDEKHLPFVTFNKCQQEWITYWKWENLSYWISTLFCGIKKYLLFEWHMKKFSSCIHLSRMYDKKLRNLRELRHITYLLFHFRNSFQCATRMCLTEIRKLYHVPLDNPHWYKHKHHGRVVSLYA